MPQRLVRRKHEFSGDESAPGRLKCERFWILIVLLRKSAPVCARWIGFEIGNELVIGYGLDFDGKFRGLKDIFVFETLIVGLWLLVHLRILTTLI
jgi:hypothetical protein